MIPQQQFYYLQWSLDYYIPLVQNPHENGVSLSHDYIPKKSFKSLGLSSPNRHEINLSYEVLNIDFGQGAAKISEVKVGDQ